MVFVAVVPVAHSVVVSVGPGAAVSVAHPVVVGSGYSGVVVVIAFDYSDVAAVGYPGVDFHLFARPETLDSVSGVLGYDW